MEKPRMRWKGLIKIGISGSRRFQECSLVPVWIERYVRKKYKDLVNVVIICGDAPGVDTYMQEWCRTTGVKNLIVHAEWARLAPTIQSGRKNPAGVIRNKHIVDLSNEFFAFWDGQSPGTKNAIWNAKQKAQETGMEMRVFNVNELRKELHIPSPVRARIPNHASKVQAHKITNWIRDAGGVKELLQGIRDYLPMKKKKKKRKLFEHPKDEDFSL